MRKTVELGLEHHKAFQKPLPPIAVDPEKDTDDYEEFDNGSEMMESLWHRGEEESEEELMKLSEDY